jgi:hypothetical protein
MAQSPRITSLASVNGPSVTFTLPFERRTRTPKALGKQPSTASRLGGRIATPLLRFVRRCLSPYPFPALPDLRS